jgi:PAS domain S-box-containing protein
MADWEQTCIRHLTQDVLLTGPLACLLGPAIEGRKQVFFGGLRTAPATMRQQFWALLLALAAVIAFCVTWTLAADQPLLTAIKAQSLPPHVRQALEQAQRQTSSRKASLVALLLGAVCGGTSLILLVFRRYRDELRLEVQRNTEALRRRHIHLAALQQITEAVNRNLDPDTVFREMTQGLARLTDPAQAGVYVLDPEDGSVLRLQYGLALRPPEPRQPPRLPVAKSLTGQCYRSGAIVAVTDHLSIYVEDENTRAQLQAAGIGSFVALPIAGEHAVLGVLGLLFDRTYAPDEDERRLFMLVGRAVAAALERAETLTKARRYAADLGGLYRFSQQLAGETEEQQILPIGTAAARRLLNARSAAIFLASREGDGATFHCAAYDGPPARAPLVRKTAFSTKDPGLLAESVRELRTAGIGIRADAAGPQTLAGEWAERSALAIPLPSAGSAAGPAGVLVLGFDGGEAVGLEAQGLAEEIARQTTASLRRARLIAKTRQQAVELQLLEQIGRALSQRLAMSHTLEQTVRSVSRLPFARAATVYICDPTTQTLHTRASSSPDPEAKRHTVPLSVPSSMAACLREGRTLVIENAYEDPRCNPELARRFQAVAQVCVPLGPSAQRVGVLLVSNPAPGAFAPDDVRLLEQVAQLASAAIERARVYEEACQRADELILLNEVGHLLVQNPVLEETLQRIAELVCRHFDLAGAAFLLLNEQRDTLACRGLTGTYAPALQHLRVPLSARDISTEAIRRNQTLVVERIGADRHAHRLVRKLLPNAASGAVVPLAATGGPLGVLAAWKAQFHAFQPRDLHTLAGVARMAAAAVARGELMQALQASQNQLQEVVDGIHAMLVSVDRAGRIQSFNAAAERMSGLERAEVMGRALAGLPNLPAADGAMLERAILRAFETNDCSEQLVLDWTVPEGAQHKIRWRSGFLYGADDRPAGMVCLGLDITKQLLLEAQLLQAQKMESVGTLAGGMAHDFNNLLGGIIGQCVLARTQTAEERTLAALSRIETAAHRGADLTAKLMAFARKSVLQPRPVDLGALIVETAALLSASLPQNIRIVTKIEPALPLVHGDPTQLQQVVLNLCVNARDAMPDGGVLTLSAESVPGNVLVEVTDTGTGMTEDVLRHLYEPFFTTKKAGKGTGLGLSVVFGIVSSHGGRISCRSEPGKGSRFSLRLPLAAAALNGPLLPRRAGSSTEMAAVATQQLNGTERVLLVDDDGILRETVRQLLSSLGYQVRATGNGADALKLLDDEPAFAPAIVLLDVIMPGLAGVPLLVELRKRLARPPVILMTGYSADQTVRAMLDAGAYDVVQKPFTIERLAGVMRRALATH